MKGELFELQNIILLYLLFINKFQQIKTPKIANLSPGKKKNQEKCLGRGLQFVAVINAKVKYIASK